MIRTILIIIILILSSTNLFSQNSGLNVRLYGSTDIAYRKLSADTSSAIITSLINGRNDIEKSLFTFSSGIAIAYKFKNQLEIQAGFGYSNFGEKAYDIPPFPNPAPMSEFEGSVLKRYYDFYDFNLTGRYAVLSNQLLCFSAHLGCSMKYFSGYREIYTYTFSSLGSNTVKTTTSSNVSYEDANILNTSIFGGFGLTFFPEKKLSYQIDPYFEYCLVPLFDAPVNQKVYKGGIKFFVIYNF